MRGSAILQPSTIPILYGSLRARPFTEQLRWKLNFSALLQNLVGNSEETHLEELAEASVDVPYPPLQIVNSIPFCLFSLYLYSAPFLNPLSPPSLLSLLIILCPHKIKTSISYILFTNGTYFCILFHTIHIFF